MVEFVIENDKKAGSGGHYDRVVSYANFLKQPPKLGDFIPCDKEGKPLEKPVFYDDYLKGINLELWHPDTKRGCKQFKEALERVLFEGFEVEHYSYTIGFMIGIKYLRYWKNGMGFEIGLDTPKTLEDLTTLGLTLKHKI